MEPITRKEKFLNGILTGDTSNLPKPITREEAYLEAIALNGGASPEQIAQAVDDYLDEHPVTPVSDEHIEEVASGLTDEVWKAQGELGAKNLLVYPYYSGKSYTINGITFSVNDDGSIVVNGTSTAYCVYFIARSIGALKYGSYILSNSELLPQKVDLQLGYYYNNAWVNKAVVDDQHKEALAEVTSEFDEKESAVRIVVDPNATIDNIIIYPMIRLASDPDDTWQPYAPTNSELMQSDNALAPLIGEYLPIANGNINKKRSVAIGATNCHFYIGAFVEKYGITSASVLDFEVSAETSSGNIVAYNRVAVNWSNKTVHIYFDELTEQTTFTCRCSKIQ